jgi:hypothetical protein
MLRIICSKPLIDLFGDNIEKEHSKRYLELFEAEVPKDNTS